MKLEIDGRLVKVFRERRTACKTCIVSYGERDIEGRVELPCDWKKALEPIKTATHEIRVIKE